jgi:hypothetical protein
LKVLAAIPQTFRKGLIENLSFLWKGKFRRVTSMLQSSFDKPFLRKKRFDDGSSDGTTEVAKAAGAQVIRHEKKRTRARALSVI